MALNSNRLKNKIHKRINDSLKANFSSIRGTTGYSAEVEKWWDILSKSIADLAFDIVEEFQTYAEVPSGITVTNSNATIKKGRVR